MKILVYFFIVFVLIVLAAIGFGLYALSQFYFPVGEGQAQTIQIEKGQGVKEIGHELEEQGLIKSSFWFETYIWLENKQDKLQAGKYSISPDTSVSKIVDLLTQGQVVKSEIWVTLPEGLSSKQMESKMVSVGLGSAKNLSDATTGDFESQYDFLSSLPSNTNIQGFLFPDTYKFSKDDNQDVLITKMLDNFDNKLIVKMRQDIKDQGRTIYEVLKMASILEKEVTSLSDRKIAAGIFWKRINDNYPLQSDATLSYILDDNKTSHTIDETKIDSPYNSYKYSGLPPTPINNPGLEAIDAAIYPQSSPYYFFLTKPDTGEAVFAKDLNEQNLNIAKYLR